MTKQKIRKSASIDKNQKYRYSLIRHWDTDQDWLNTCVGTWRNPRVAWIMLNPSVADDKIDDPTIRKCIGFSKRWGYSAMVVNNLFAYRATDPVDLRKAISPWGSDNMFHLEFTFRQCKRHNDLLVLAWGRHGNIYEVGSKLIEVLKRYDLYRRAHCFGLTKNGQPFHPLMLSYSTPLVYHSQFAEETDVGKNLQEITTRKGRNNGKRIML